MTGRTVRRALTAAYPRQWARDGRTDELLEVLEDRCTRHPSRNFRWREIADVAVHGLGARWAGSVATLVRLRIAQLSLASGTGLAVMLLLLAEWLPGRPGTAADDRFGPFVSPGAALYLSTIALAVLVLLRARRAAAVVAGVNLVGPIAVIVLPHVVDQTRPGLPALLAVELFSLGVVVGWGPLHRSATRTTWPVLAGLAAGAATWFTNRTTGPDDDRLAFTSPHGGLDDVALVAVLGVAAALVLALVAVVLDPSWLVGVLVVAVGWAALGVRVAVGNDGPTFVAAYLVVWALGAVVLAVHRHAAARRRAPAAAAG